MPVVLISGGTGLIGTNLTRHLIEKNYEVIILTRDKDRSSENSKISYAHWDVKNQEIDDEALKKADHIIHLAGAGVILSSQSLHVSPRKELSAGSVSINPSFLLGGLSSAPYQPMAEAEINDFTW